MGRYGDPIDPQGYRKGLTNMVNLLRPGGVFYLSVPIGMERVEFNANWVFDPRTIVNTMAENGLALGGLTTFSHTDGIRELEPTEVNLADLATKHYTLGIFKFTKSVEGN